MMSEYWDCFPRETLVKLIKKGEINYINAHNLYFLLNKFKKYTLSVFRTNIINIYRNIGDDFEIATRRDVVIIKLPILYKFDVLSNVLSSEYSDNIELITTEEYFTLVLPRDDIMLVEFDSSDSRIKKVYFIFGYKFLLIVYSDGDIIVVESYPLKLSYHIQKYFVDRIIEMTSKEVKDIDDFDVGVIERCILVKDLQNIKKRIEYFVFKYLRDKYSEHPKSKPRILSLDIEERQ